MKHTARKRMKRFFSPRHIAVVGATTKNQWFSNLMEYASRSGFKSSFYPVNPKAAEVKGIRAYPSIGELPSGIIDFAVVIVKSTLVLGVIEELRHRGVRDVLLISSGFAEMGREGAAKQDQLKSYCEDNDILLMGPNCLGFINLIEGASVFAGGSVEGELLQGDIAVIGQSGATTEIITSKLLMRSLGISLYATTGNEAMLTTEDCMEYLVHDGGTRVITAFMEGFRDIPCMKEVAIAAAERQVPIIILKVGRSEKGKQAASSHTGALAGNDEVMEGFFSQYGIIRVDSIDELVETAGIFSRCKLPEGGRIGICTLSGGLCGLYADLCARYGILVPGLSEKSVASLRAVLPEFAQPDNPLDLTGSGFWGGMREILTILLDDENLDIIAPLSFAPSGDNDDMPLKFNETFLGLARSAPKPVIPLTFREVNDYARRYYYEHGVYFIEHAEDSFKAIAHLIRYAEFQKRFQDKEK
ncbi:MAG: acetate--CoA ligase family protein [Desulfomonilia bacterium]